MRQLLFDGGIVVSTRFDTSEATSLAFQSVVQADGDILEWAHPEAIARPDLHRRHLEAIRSELAVLSALGPLFRGLPWAAVGVGFLIGLRGFDPGALNSGALGPAALASPLLFSAAGYAIGRVAIVAIKLALRVMPLDVPKDLQDLVADDRRSSGRSSRGARQT